MLYVLLLQDYRLHTDYTSFLLSLPAGVRLLSTFRVPSAGLWRAEVSRCSFRRTSPTSEEERVCRIYQLQPTNPAAGCPSARLGFTVQLPACIAWLPPLQGYRGSAARGQPRSPLSAQHLPLELQQRPSSGSDACRSFLANYPSTLFSDFLYLEGYMTLHSLESKQLKWNTNCILL